MARYNRFNIFDVKPREAVAPIFGREAQNISTELLEGSDFVQKGIARIGIDGKLISNVTGKTLEGDDFYNKYDPQECIQLMNSQS